MNTEPPEGDDLQRMLVSMKQTVLERAIPRPRRRRRRSGVVVGVVALLALGTATGAVALTLSQQDRPVAAPVQTQEPAPAPSATTPTSAPITATPTPRPTTAPTDLTAKIPADCRALVPADDYDRLFGTTPVLRVVGPGDEQGVDPSAVPTELYCLWKAPRSDVRTLAVTLGTGTPEQLAALETEFYEGWPTPSCTEADGIRTCTELRGHPEYGTDWARTMYVRGDTWLQIDQSNFPTNGLLPAVVGEVWGD